MAQLKRKYIDKHWFMFIIRGILAAGFGCFALFGGMADLESMIAIISVFLLFMGIVDAAGALYASTKKHGWVNSIIDSAIDVIAAVTLLFCANGDLTISLIIISVYTIISGVVDLFHGFLSTVDPTDRFIMILAGIIGIVTGFVILNSGSFEMMTFIRFFGVYLLIVGVTSMVYGVHNRAQEMEDKAARREAIKAKSKKTATKKKARK